MIPYFRPKLSDLFTLSQRQLLENHTLAFRAAHAYKAHIWQYVHPPPVQPLIYSRGTYWLVWLRGWVCI